MTDGSPVTGKIIDGRYEILRPLGQGAFGHTVLARSTDTQAQVAIKTLQPERADTVKAFELFEREASVLAGLRHHGIPAIIESFQADWEDGQAAFLVMEYLEGPTLEQIIEQGHDWSPDDIVTIVHDLAAILEYLHDRVPPIIHRDIKPSNVILRDEKHPALVDFGAVRNVFRAPGEGGSTVVGTYGYMPYEQYMGQATPASDIYALGATLLHVLTGRPPADFLSDEGHLDVPDNLPGGNRLQTILRRMVAPAVAHRYADARALRRALLDQPAPLPVPAAASSLVPANQGSAEKLLTTIPDAPRRIGADMPEAFKSRTMSMWEMMNTMVGRSDAEPNVGSIALTGFLSLASIGVLPMMLWFMNLSHKRRLKPFFENGTATLATVQGIVVGGSQMGERLGRVTYEFEADGELHRGADQIAPSVSDRWRPGDSIVVLYLPDKNYDSVILSAR